MRLMAKDMFGDFFTSQLVISQDGSVSDPVHTGERVGRGIVARVDLGCEELKLVLQYDGSGHLERSRRDSDSKVSTELANLGWHELRLTYGHLKDRDLFYSTVAGGIALCRSRQGR